MGSPPSNSSARGRASMRLARKAGYLSSMARRNPSPPCLTPQVARSRACSQRSPPSVDASASSWSSSNFKTSSSGSCGPTARSICCTRQTLVHNLSKASSSAGLLMERNAAQASRVAAEAVRNWAEASPPSMPMPRTRSAGRSSTLHDPWTSAIQSKFTAALASGLPSSRAVDLHSSSAARVPPRA